jgi:endonuclease YncB( thermonuclease family)
MMNKTVEAKVVSVYDGDTIKAIFPLNGVLYKWNCRLSGVDTPEIRTRNEREKKYGYIVRDKLREQILDQVVNVECGELDKYGRLLVTVYKGEQDMNRWLIDNDYAFAYDGGTKRSWEDFLISAEQEVI